jgi:hypothetical protein
MFFVILYQEVRAITFTERRFMYAWLLGVYTVPRSSPPPPPRSRPPSTPSSGVGGLPIAPSGSLCLSKWGVGAPSYGRSRVRILPAAWCSCTSHNCLQAILQCPLIKLNLDRVKSCAHCSTSNDEMPLHVRLWVTSSHAPIPNSMREDICSSLPYF